MAAPTVLSLPDSNIQPNTQLSGTGQPNATVTVDDVRGMPIATTLVDGTGNWTVVLSNVSPSIASMEVRQSDASHPLSDPIVIDGLAPRPTVIDDGDIAQGTPKPLMMNGFANAMVSVTDRLIECDPDPTVQCFPVVTVLVPLGADGSGQFPRAAELAGHHQVTMVYYDDYGISSGTTTHLYWCYIQVPES
jgi:hypothetical protein